MTCTPKELERSLPNMSGFPESRKKRGFSDLGMCDDRCIKSPSITPFSRGNILYRFFEPDSLWKAPFVLWIHDVRMPQRVPTYHVKFQKYNKHLNRLLGKTSSKGSNGTQNCVVKLDVMMKTLLWDLFSILILRLVTQTLLLYKLHLVEAGSLIFQRGSYKISINEGTDSIPTTCLSSFYMSSRSKFSYSTKH